MEAPGSLQVIKMYRSMAHGTQETLISYLVECLGRPKVANVRRETGKFDKGLLVEEPTLISFAICCNGFLLLTML